MIDAMALRKLTKEHESVSRKAEELKAAVTEAAKHGLYYLDIRVATESEEKVIMAAAPLAFGAGIAWSMKEHEIDDDPFHGKSYRTHFRVDW